MVDIHLYRPAYIVGVFLHQRLELPHLEVGAVYLLIGVGLYVHDNVRADAVLFALRHGIAVRAAARPLHALLLAVFAREHRDLIRDHEGRVEADAELADYGDILRLALGLVHLALELERAALCDNAEVAFRLLRGHADAVVAHGDGARVLIHNDVYAEIVPVQPDVLIRQRKIAQLVYRVRRVGYDLSEEYLLVCIDRIDHQVEKPLRLRLELLFSHYIYASRTQNIS